MSDVRVFESTTEIERALVELHERAFAEANKLSVALTGGSAANLYGALAKSTTIDWARVHVYFGDERCVPPDHADSNYRLAKDKFLDHVAIPAPNVHRVRGEAPPEEAARAYVEELLVTTDAGAIDLVHLGMGPDGHLCSLFPGHALLEESGRLVASLTDSPKPPPARVTLTLPALFRARRVVFIVMGEGKAESARAAIEDPESKLPAAIVHRHMSANGDRSTWLLDRAAASKLKA